MTGQPSGARGGSASAPARRARTRLDDDVSFLLARANALSLGAGNAALAKFGLRVRSYSVLALAVGDARPSQRELAEYLRLDPSQVVSLVDELQRRGFVRREPDPVDRRANVVVATAEGEACFERARVAVRAGEERLHAGLSEADRIRLSELLQQLAFPS